MKFVEMDITMNQYYKIRMKHNENKKHNIIGEEM
jgi:hypothetical protein